MDFVNCLNWMEEEFNITNISFCMNDKTYTLDRDIYLGDLYWEYKDNKELLSFKIENNNGIDEFIAKLNMAIYKSYNVIIRLDSNIGSIININMYCGKFDYSSTIKDTTLYFYGSLNIDSDYKGEIINYLI